uniref:Uncharacterized protein n=1 Tax=Mycena chlorophos TaxID=658473 RepID=A0ABQ0L424_MYCCL|nr:predicted protein [Mycena chlorophos]
MPDPVPLPARGAHTAPKFDASKPEELRRFIDDVEYALKLAKITDDQEKKVAVARYMSVTDEAYVKSLPEFKAAETYEAFKKAVLARYAGNNEDNLYSLRDWHTLLGAISHKGIQSEKELAEFFRDFVRMGNFLMDKGRLSKTEQSNAFLRALQPASLQAAVKQRLQIKKPDVHVDDPYEVSDIYDAAKFALAGSSFYATSVPAPEKTEPKKESTEMSALLQAMTQLVQVMSATHAHAPANTTAGNSSAGTTNSSTGSNNNNQNKPRRDGCSYCWDLLHLWRTCGNLESDKREGVCKVGDNNKLVLPDGQEPPWVRGISLRERFLRYHAANPGKKVVPQLIIQVTAEAPTASVYFLDEEERLKQLTADALALQTRKAAREALKAGKSANPEPKIPAPAPAPAKPDTTGPSPNSAPIPNSGPAPELPSVPFPEHPYSAAKDAAYAPPKDRNVGALSKPATKPAIAVTDEAKRVFNAALDAEFLMTNRKLLAISPDIRSQYREMVTPRRHPVKDQLLNENSEDADPFGGFSESELYETPTKEAREAAISNTMPGAFMNREVPAGLQVGHDEYATLYNQGLLSDDLVVSSDSKSIRCITPIIENRLVAECIIDPGSQICAMSENLFHELGIVYDPTVILNMQSANGAITLSLGLARNVAFKVSDITLYLQVHVVRNPAYDVLLGRPFDVLTRSIVRNYEDSNQDLTIHDPNSGRALTVATVFTVQDVIPDGDLALVIESDPSQPNGFSISAYKSLEKDTPAHIQLAYLAACKNLGNNYTTVHSAHYVAQPAFSAPAVSPSNKFASVYSVCDNHPEAFHLPDDVARISHAVPLWTTHQRRHPFSALRDTKPVSVDLNTLSDISPPSPVPPIARVFAGKRYKPVAKKVRPILGSLPDEFRIIRNITGDPLENIPILDPNPPPFVPTGRYTADRKAALDAAHSEDFLWPEERALLHYFMMLHNDAFAWEDSERGSFRADFFPPVEIPVMPHTPWVLRNIPIPPGIYDQVCDLIRTKIAAGVYEPSNSSYRSRWFCVVKKDGTSLRLVHSLEPLNAVTIQHSGVPPFTEQLAEHFAGRACGAMLDLYVGYDERLLSPSSRDYTTFQTPFGALRLVTLPMGWTNSVLVFHDDIFDFIMEKEVT